MKWLPLVGLLVLASCKRPPLLEGFFSGGIAGNACPPASEPRGSCSNPDCGVPCEATTKCDPASAACPPGFTCDASLDEPYCMPALLCQAASECAAGDYCAVDGTNPGICVPVVLADVPCASADDCAWPFTCRDGACALWCYPGSSDDLCPTGTTCGDYQCEP